MDAARARLSAELGAVDPLAEAAAELGLGHMSGAELRQLAGAAGADGELGGGGGMHAPGGGLDDMLGGAGADPSSNMFKDFFDAMPEEVVVVVVVVVVATFHYMLPPG